MRFFILVLAMISGMALPVLAAGQDPVITIHPDGSFSVNGETSEKIVTPPAEAVEPTVKEIPKVELQLIAPAEVKEDLVKASPPPLPLVKPARQSKKEEAFPAVKESIGKMYVYEEKPRQPGPVTRDEALRVALDVAPPSRSTEVYPADFNGLKVFQVVFKTEDGDQYILVDRQTGAIVKH